MSSEPSDNSKIPVKCWKSLYMKLTSVKVLYHEDDIEKELKSCEEYFEKGTFQVWSLLHVSDCEPESRENRNLTFMESFYQRLSKILKVDLETSKEVFANYLLYNCNDAGNMLQERLEKNVRAVLLSAWSFHAQERIFFLKCYFHIISSCESIDPDAPYARTFKNFLSKVSIRDRYSSMLKEYTKLIQQQLPSTTDYGVLADLLVPLWVNYNLREQLEMLLILILLTSRIDVSLEDIDHLVDLVQITSFGRYQCFFYHHSHLTDHQVFLQKQVYYAINLHAIQILSRGWKTDIYQGDMAKFNAHNKILYPKSYDMQQGPIVIAWILILYYKLMNASTFEEQLSDQSFIILDDDIWKGIDDAVHSNIMDITLIANVMEPIIDEMVYAMFTDFGIAAFRSRQTLSSIVTFFCKFHTFPFNQSTTAILHYFRERFPLDCCCLFKILGAVLNWTTGENRKEILQLMNDLKYAVNRDECNLQCLELNKYVLEHQLQPLKCIPDISIPRGTPAVQDFEENIVIIQKSLPIWDIMRNYLATYWNGKTVDSTLLNTVTEIIKFVDVSLQKTKTINDDILKFSELVVRVLWKSSTGRNSCEEMKLLAACIELQSVLFCIIPEDIIKCFEIYNFLPGYPARMKYRDIQMHEMYYTQSRIYTIVCNIEAKTGKYSVLFAYLHFFHNLVQNLFGSWYTVAGLKFIFHVYNNVINDFWRFENLDDRNLIIWNCTEITHKILNYGLKNLYETNEGNALLDFEETENNYVSPTTYFITKSCVSAILNNVNESLVLSTATAGDAALLETIMESACWNRGKSAIFINTITYSLSLVQRSLIYMSLENELRKNENLKKNELCIDHLFQPERCLALLSYRYNCFSDTISLLAIKLLIKLASIKEDCMFSWLQCSNDLLQKEFLYPLYSNIESNSVKSSLLALSAVCIAKQIVIADALLEIDKVRRICVEKSATESTDEWQNLLVFSSEYIRDIDKTPEKYLSHMHSAVLNVIHACWEKKLKVPQQYFKMSKEFWKYLLLPLQSEPSPKFHGYNFILETICVEINNSEIVDPNLIAEVKIFLNSTWFMKWTKFCADVIDDEPTLTVEFECITNPISAVAESWKKFMKMVANHCSSLVEDPSLTAFTVLDNLIYELDDFEARKKGKFLCDIYRTYLVTWEGRCSDKSRWRNELSGVSRMFVLLNKFREEYSNPYFFSALLEICYKVIEFGKKNMSLSEGIEDKLNFLLACSGILNQELTTFSKMVVDEDNALAEYAPLLLHSCIYIDIVENLNVSTELISFVLREIDFMSPLLNISCHILAMGCATKTTKMLLQFQNYIFERYPFVKKNYTFNDTMLKIFQLVFPEEMSQKQGNNGDNLIDLFKDAERNNLYTYGIRFVLNLTKDRSGDSKSLLLEFNSKNKFYLYTILNMIESTVRKEDLRLVIAVASVYWRLSQNMHLCKYSEINDLVQPMFLLFKCVKSAVSMITQPSKMCSLLFNVPAHQLQSFFDNCDSKERVQRALHDTYKNLIWLVKIGMQTLFTFCFDAETILNGRWPSEDWNFRWLNKVLDEKSCTFPLLFLSQDNLQEDFITFATFITLEHRAITNRSKTNINALENLVVGNKIAIMDYDKSGITLLAVSRFLLAQSTMYLLHPQIDQAKKLFFLNQIFVNLKEFIRNAINNAANDDIEIPLLIEKDDVDEDVSVLTLEEDDADKDVPVSTIENDVVDKDVSVSTIEKDVVEEDVSFSTALKPPTRPEVSKKRSFEEESVPSQTSTEPIPARKVLSLRGVRSKPVINAVSGEESSVDNEPAINTVSDNEASVDDIVSNSPHLGKLHTVELNIVARLFFKLITTFKHS